MNDIFIFFKLIFNKFWTYEDENWDYELDDSTTEDKITIDQGVESLWSDDVPEEKATSKSDEMIEMLES